MSRRSLDQTLEITRSIDRARSPADIAEALLFTGARFGFERVLAGTMPAPGSTRSQQLAHVLLADWPDEWARRYFSHGYLFADPAIRRVRAVGGPFLWSELELDCAEDAAARRVMNEAGEFGLRAGFTVPLAMLDGAVAGFSLAGERVELPPAMRGALTLIGSYAVARCVQLASPVDAARRRPPRLSPRETEALQWAAEGRTEGEIAEAMGISEHGVDKHMRVARRKLGTRNRTHAVAEAIRLGLVR
ncbi:LuxR family transcriptional regulator [Salinarimonas sp.]|jgi:LuxR family quorum sensing-dependent transcriptional regulator|uniref:LuxR family transcriptional regulator n=1 Tax=Salinarimonas sp. TaxID=2766526 RepID=UPI0032D993DB